MDSRTSLVDGVIALSLLVLLQALVAMATARIPSLRTVVTTSPTVLFVDGEERLDVMRRQRVSLEELRQAVAGTGAGDLASVAAVVLETDGTMSLISNQSRSPRRAPDGLILRATGTAGTPGATGK